MSAIIHITNTARTNPNAIFELVSENTKANAAPTHPNAIQAVVTDSADTAETLINISAGSRLETTRINNLGATICENELRLTTELADMLMNPP